MKPRLVHRALVSSHHGRSRLLGLTAALAVTLVVFAAAGCTRSPRDDMSARLAAEDAVLAAALGDSARPFPPRSIVGDTIWLHQELEALLSRPTDEVDPDALAAHWRAILADVPRALAADYRSAQRLPRRLVRLPAVDGRPVRFRSDPLLVTDAPRWVARISRVGFNEALDSAIVYVSVSCRGSAAMAPP